MRLALTIALAACTLCAQNKGDANFYSPKKEAALGATLTTEFRSHATIVDSDAAQAFVNRIGARLAAAIPKSPFPYTFTVIADTPNNVTHEPIALPGGSIFVPAELILTAHSEAEFAGMLAHAMVHISERHYTRNDTRLQIANQAAIPIIFMGGGWASEEILQASTALAPIGFLRLFREMETQADKLAPAIAARAGFDPAALALYLGRVPSPNTSTFFSSMPDPNDRVATIQKVVKSLPASTYATPADDFSAFQLEVRAHLPF